MARIIKSYSTEAGGIKDFLVPGVAQVVLFLLIGIALLILFNAQAIWDQISNGLYTQATSAPSDAVTSQGFFESALGGRLPQIIFWGGIGMIMYVVVWFSWNIVTNVRNDVAADSFVHPKNYKRGQYWLAVLARKAFFGLSVFVFIVYTAVLISFLPILSDLTYSAVNNFSSAGDVIDILGSVLVIGALLYVFDLLLRVSIHSWQTIYKDL